MNIWHIIPWALLSIVIASLYKYRHRRIQEELRALTGGWLADAEWYRKRLDADGKPVAHCLEANAKSLNEVLDKWK